MGRECYISRSIFPLPRRPPGGRIAGMRNDLISRIQHLLRVAKSLFVGCGCLIMAVVFPLFLWWFWGIVKDTYP